MSTQKEPGFLPDDMFPPVPAASAATPDFAPGTPPLAGDPLLDYDHGLPIDYITPHVPQWYMLRIGLRVASIAMMLLLVGGIGAGILLAIASSFSYGNRIIPMLLGFVTGTGAIGGTVALLVAFGFLMGAPRTLAMRGMGRAAFAFSLSPLAVLLLVLMIEAIDSGPDRGEPFVILGEAGFGTAIILLVVMARRAAGVFRCPTGFEITLVVGLALIVVGIACTWGMMYAERTLDWSRRWDATQVLAGIGSVGGGIGFGLIGLVLHGLAARMRAALPSMQRFASIEAKAPTRRHRVGAGFHDTGVRAAVHDDWMALQVPLGPIQVSIWRKKVGGGWLVSGTPKLASWQHFVHDPTHTLWDGRALPPGLLDTDGGSGADGRAHSPHSTGAPDGL